MSMFRTFFQSYPVYPTQGSHQVPSRTSIYVYFSTEELTFHSHLPDGQGCKQVIYQLNENESENLQDTCLKESWSLSFF